MIYPKFNRMSIELAGFNKSPVQYYSTRIKITARYSFLHDVFFRAEYITLMKLIGNFTIFVSANDFNLLGTKDRTRTSSKFVNHFLILYCSRFGLN